MFESTPITQAMTPDPIVIGPDELREGKMVVRFDKKAPDLPYIDAGFAVLGLEVVTANGEIIRTGGKQFRAEPGKTLRIPSLDIEPGNEVKFEEVLAKAEVGEHHAKIAPIGMIVVQRVRPELRHEGASQRAVILLRALVVRQVAGGISHRISPIGLIAVTAVFAAASFCSSVRGGGAALGVVTHPPRALRLRDRTSAGSLGRMGRAM